MTIRDWLTKSVKELDAAGIGTGRLDTLVLLEDEMNPVRSKDSKNTTGTALANRTSNGANKNRAQLLAHPELELTSGQISRLNRKITRRARHEPLAYIRGRTEFYGRDFLVDKHVLEPRPESETMIDLLKVLFCIQPTFSKTACKVQPCKVVDVGTGSGAIAITAKLEIPDIDVVATDISSSAIRIAKSNDKTYNTKIRFCQGDLLQPVASLLTPSSILLCNLPYVPDHYQINQAAAMEPKVAIFGGPDGLDLYRKLFKQLKGQEYAQFVLTESLPFQHADLASIAAGAGYKLFKSEDFIQVFQKVDSA